MQPILKITKDRNGKEVDRSMCVIPDHYEDTFRMVLVNSPGITKIKDVLQQFYEVKCITDEYDNTVCIVLRHMDYSFSGEGFASQFKSFFPCTSVTHLRKETFTR